MRAAEIIRERGWCQKETRDPDGRVCLSGAIHDAIIELYGWQPYPDPHFDAAKALVLSRIDYKPPAGNGLAYTVALTAWNDSSSRTEEEVLRCLEGR